MSEDRIAEIDDFIFNVVFKAKNEEEQCRKIYSEWAHTYDSDMKTINYNGPWKLVQSLIELKVSKTAHILDVCAGTGEVGVCLRKFGFNNIDALDGCVEMLNIAKKKGIYNNYIEEIILSNKEISILHGDKYDVALLCGCIAPSHLQADALDQIIKIMKRNGGLIAFIEEDSRKTDVYEKYNALIHLKVAELCKTHAWKYVDNYPKLLDDLYDGEAWYLHIFQVL